jgi:hypothetical protein
MSQVMKFQYQAKIQVSAGGPIRWITWWVAVFMVCFGLSGCFGGNQRKSAAPHAAGAPIVPDDVTGRWKLSIVNHGSQEDIGLVEIKHDAKQSDNKYTIALLDLPNAKTVEVKSVKVSDVGQVDYELADSNFTYAFTGRLDGDAIWGSYSVHYFQFSPAKLERTKLDKLPPPAPSPVPQFDGFMAALNSSDPYSALKTFVEGAENNPLLFDAYEAMCHHLKKKKLDRKAIDEFISEYRKAIEIWGPSLAFLVDLHVGHALATQQIEPELSRALLAVADSNITEVAPIETTGKLIEGWILLNQPDLALKRLPQLREKDPTNPGLLWLYARAKEKAKDIDEALWAYTKVAVIPGFERQLKSPGIDLPSFSALRLWKEKHGNSTVGYEESAVKALDEVMQTFVPQRTPEKRAPDAFVPLVEMFTGTWNDPCIASDIAVESLRRAYSPEEVVIINFHQHHPYIDPLANDSSVKRALFYHKREAPALVVNGEPIEESLGMASATGALPILAGLRAEVDAAVNQTTPISIKMTAVREKDEIKIKADVSGIKTTEHEPRLYLVLVENEIRYLAPNGIYRHNCVARAFAGGLKGLGLGKGNTSHFEVISLSELKAELLNHLKQFESEREFPFKPMDFKKLQVVAFVQANHTRAILQSAVVDVTGDMPSAAESEAQPETAPGPEPKPEI